MTGIIWLAIELAIRGKLNCNVIFDVGDMGVNVDNFYKFGKKKLLTFYTASFFLQ